MSSVNYKTTIVQYFDISWVEVEISSHREIEKWARGHKKHFNSYWHCE